jgi:hypothetical protein
MVAIRRENGLHASVSHTPVIFHLSSKRNEEEIG